MEIRTALKGAVGYIVPSEWKIEIARHGDAYRMVYEELLERPRNIDPDTFEKAIANTLSLLSMLNAKVEILYKDPDRARFRIELVAPLEKIASLIIGEFISMSDIGDTTLRDILTAITLQSYALRTMRKG